MIGQILEDGRRVLTPIGILAAIAVVCLCVGSLLVTLDYRSQLQSTRTQQRQLETSFNSYAEAEFAACERRNKLSALVRGLEQADVQLQRQMIAIDKKNPVANDQVRRSRIAAWQRKLRADLRYLQVNIPSCEAPPQVAGVRTSSTGG